MQDVGVTTIPPSTPALSRAYLAAKRIVVDQGFAHEIAWQSRTRPSEVTAPVFAREAAWVVLSAGMREAVVRRVFPRLAEELHQFDPGALSDWQLARESTLQVFANERKVDAILAIMDTARAMGDQGVRDALVEDAEGFLSSLPYVGPVTWCHLAKNLGVQVAKPDRHLMRLARITCRQSVKDLCDEISSWIGESVAVVDVVLWRWSVLHARECATTCVPMLHVEPA